MPIDASLVPPLSEPRSSEISSCVGVLRQLPISLDETATFVSLKLTSKRRFGDKLLLLDDRSRFCSKLLQPDGRSIHCLTQPAVALIIVGWCPVSYKHTLVLRKLERLLKIITV